MKLGPTDDCRHCGDRIMVCRIRGGTWLPFDFRMVAATPDPVEAYVPVRVGPILALVPVGEVPPRWLDGVRWYAQQHRCAEFMRAASAQRHERAAQRLEVRSLAAAVTEYFATAHRAGQEA